MSALLQYFYIPSANNNVVDFKKIPIIQVLKRMTHSHFIFTINWLISMQRETILHCSIVTICHFVKGKHCHYVIYLSKIVKEFSKPLYFKIYISLIRQAKYM